MSREDQDPYGLDYHVEGCLEESVWEDDGGQLRSALEISERECPACFHEWDMWTSILEHTATPTFDEHGNQTGSEPGDPVWGDLALRGFTILEMVTEFHYPVAQLSAQDYALMKAVHQEQRRRKGQRDIQERERLRRER